MMNRIYNCGNPYQGAFRKVLCVCSAGLLRSPTAAFVLSQEPFNCNTRCAGIEDSYALFPVELVHVIWADTIVCMTQQHETNLRAKFEGNEKYLAGKLVTLHIPDNYEYRNSELIELIKTKFQKFLDEEKEMNRG